MQDDTDSNATDLPVEGDGDETTELGRRSGDWRLRRKAERKARWSVRPARRQPRTTIMARLRRNRSL